MGVWGRGQCGAAAQTWGWRVSEGPPQQALLVCQQLVSSCVGLNVLQAQHTHLLVQQHNRFRHLDVRMGGQSEEEGGKGPLGGSSTVPMGTGCAWDIGG